MIIRRSASRSAYTHDDEAVLQAWSKAREFAGTPTPQFASWLDGLRDFHFCKDYWHVVGSQWFDDAEKRLAGDTENVIRVTMWKFDELTRYIMEREGISCVACGFHVPWSWLGRLYYNFPGHTDVLREIDKRQTFHHLAPPLICRECAIDLSMMLLPMVKPKAREAAVNRLCVRAVSIEARA